MKKFLLICLIMLCSCFNSAFAEKIPVRISPVKIISTHHDEVEIGDWLTFEVVSDVYADDKLAIQKGAKIYGFVDFFHPNGWAGDAAEIKIKTFETTGVSGKKVIINYPLVISGNSVKARDAKQYLSRVLTNFIRGSEIYIEPDTKAFNIFLVK